MQKYAIRIEAADKITVQESGEQMLSVLFKIRSDRKVEYTVTEADLEKPEFGKNEVGDVVEVLEVVSTNRHGFPLDITPEELEAELQGVLAAFTQDAETAEASAEFAAKDTQADETIASVVGKEITN